MAFKMKGLGMTATAAIDKLTSNDPTLTTCDLANNAVLQMKGPELIPKLAAALAQNMVCQELNLTNCNITDAMCSEIATALAKNTALVTLNLEKNQISNDGATSLANALAGNDMLMQMNLLGQKGTRLGDATLHAFDEMFKTNVTLLKIIWRLESRQSFRLNKMFTRNNDIDRRIKAGKEYADLLPAGVAPGSGVPHLRDSISDADHGCVGAVQERAAQRKRRVRHASAGQAAARLMAATLWRLQPRDLGVHRVHDGLPRIVRRCLLISGRG